MTIACCKANIIDVFNASGSDCANKKHFTIDRAHFFCRSGLKIGYFYKKRCLQNKARCYACPI